MFIQQVQTLFRFLCSPYTSFIEHELFKPFSLEQFEWSNKETHKDRSKSHLASETFQSRNN